LAQHKFLRIYAQKDFEQNSKSKLSPSEKIRKLFRQRNAGGRLFHFQEQLKIDGILTIDFRYGSLVPHSIAIIGCTPHSD
jgi:hypothetical protein